jgi:hypothetical protein
LGAKIPLKVVEEKFYGMRGVLLGAKIPLKVVRGIRSKIIPIVNNL